MIRALIFWIVVSLAINVLTGLVAFAMATAEAPKPALPQSTAGIVVLTGGSGERIRRAAQLLQNKTGQRLLVSGVNPKVSEPDLLGLSGLSSQDLSCCLDVDRHAMNTRGNARQIAIWAKIHNYDHLLVVTSGYHMPRTLLELQAALPTTALWPVSVASTGPAKQHLLRRSVTEYAKYLVVLVLGVPEPNGTEAS